MPFGQGQALLDLLDERKRTERELAAAKGRLTQINERIAGICGPTLANAYQREGKNSGTVKFAIDNHLLKSVVDKRVEWDSDILKEIANDLPPGMSHSLFKIVYSVPEAMFKAVLDPTLKARLTLARTVKYGDPKVTLAENEDA